MGLMRAANFGMQGFYNPATGRWQDANEPPAPAPAPPQRSPPAPRRTGLLSAAERQQQPAPQAQSPLMAMPSQGLPQALPQSAPGAPGSPGGPPQVQRQPFDVNAMFESPLMQYGLAALAAGQPGGGGWSSFAPQAMQIGQQQQQRKRQDRQDQRDDQLWQRQQTQFEWAEQGQQRQQQERADLERWVASLPEEDQRIARANPAMAYQAFMEARAAAQQPITPFQQQQLDLQRRGLDIDAMNAQTNAARANMDRPLRGPDASLLQDVREQAMRSQALVSLGDEFLASNARNATGELSRYNPLNLISADRDSMKAVESRMRGYMRPPNSGATSDFEQRLYGMGTPSTNRIGLSNQMIVDSHRAQARLDRARANYYEMYAGERGNLYGAEQAFQQSQEFRSIQAEFEQRWGSGSGSQARSYGSDLPDPRNFREGHRLEDDNGRSVVLRNGRWLREDRIHNIGAGTR